MPSQLGAATPILQLLAPPLAPEFDSASHNCDGIRDSQSHLLHVDPGADERLSFATRKMLSRIDKTLSGGELWTVVVRP